MIVMVESLSLFESQWDSFIFYKKSNRPISQQFHLDKSRVEHVATPEELTLYQYRNNINTYEEMFTTEKNWEYYKKIVNPFELVYTQKKYDEFPESVSTVKPLSRSYFKMIELLDIMCFFSPPMKTIKTAHVCEGPGGFIEAIFDKAAKSHCIVQAVAMTLKSKFNNVPGWKKAAAFLKKNQNVRILYGEDNTGDIMKPENQQYFIDYAAHPYYGGKVDMFTADGGFDFSCDYMKQEQMVFPLLLASTKMGFEVLKKGGTFILKIFDFYHKSTTDLLYILSFHFEEWTVYKPAMSRPCNPEHYFIGRGFIGCSEEIFDTLRLWCVFFETNTPLESLLKIEYPPEFTSLLLKLHSMSYQLQIQYLEKVFHMIKTQNENLIKKCLETNYALSTEWCKRFKVQTVNMSSFIESNKEIDDG
jgi:23S rRNA U2552 (ribose-2'-O)-methylase RlmE/FtsJ